MPTELWPLLLAVGGGFAVVGKSTIFFEGFICNFGIWVSWDMFMGFLDALKLFYRLTTEASRDTLNSQAKSPNFDSLTRFYLIWFINSITLISDDGLEIPNTMVLFDPKKRDRHLYTYFLHLCGAWHISGNLNESCLNMLKSNWHKSVRKKNIFVFHLSCHSTKSMVKLKILICGQLGPRRKGWPLPVSLSDLFVVASTQPASTAGQTTDFNCQPHRFLSRDGDDDDLDWRTHPSSGLVTQFQVTWEPITHKPNDRTINNRSMTKSLVLLFHFVSRRREHFLLPSVCFDRCIALFDIRKNRLGWLWLQFWQLLFILKNNPATPKGKRLLIGTTNTKRSVNFSWNQSMIIVLMTN